MYDAGDLLTEAAADLAKYYYEITLIISLLYFAVFILSVWGVLHKLSKKFTSCLAMFAINMIGHIFMFLLMMTTCIMVMTPFL